MHFIIELSHKFLLLCLRFAIIYKLIITLVIYKTVNFFESKATDVSNFIDRLFSNFRNSFSCGLTHFYSSLAYGFPNFFHLAKEARFYDTTSARGATPTHTSCIYDDKLGTTT